MRNGFGFAVSLLLSVGLLPLNSPGQTTGGAAPAQTIKFDTIPNQILGVSPFVIAAEASSGLPVSFASKTPAVCRNADDLVTLLSAGTCSITASQAGNASYNPAASVTLSFTVSQAKVSGSFMAAASSPFAVGPYGTFPDALAVGDFNGDGIPDIATSNGGAGSVTILLGNVGGGFTASTGSPIMVGQQPTSVVVGDFNGDGNQDLAVATTNNTADFNVPGSITVLLGNGSGGFTAAAGSPFTVGAYPYVVVGDFNGDGIQDLATANFVGNNLTVLLGNGSGGFTAAAGSPFISGSSPVSVVVGDFNGDGVQDLAISNEGSNNVTVLLGNGSGGFTPAPGNPFAVGSGPISLAVGDFNGDGIQDLAVANQTTSNITVLLGQVSGGFKPATGSPFAVGHPPSSVVVGDFNGDGIQDLATANLLSDDATVLLGNGFGGFAVTPSSPLAADERTRAIVAADFNGDGIEDLALVNNHTSDVTVLLGFVAGNIAQTITFGPLSGVTYGVAPIMIGATASSGLTVSFVSTTYTVCTVAATTVTIVSGGACTIVASQVGNAVYAAAATVMQSFTANPASQTITFGPLSNQLPGSTPPALSAIATSGLTVTFTSNSISVCTVSGATITLVTAGACSITASQAGNANYSAATSVTQTFTVATATGVTIQTSPEGLQFSVDGGAALIAPQTLNLSQGAHTIAVAATQAGTAGTQYVLAGWSDSGAATHAITVGGSAATYTASFQTQYQLTISASPLAGGTVSPASGTFYNAGTVVSIGATSNSGYVFSGWTGSVASAGSASTMATLSAALTVTANFSLSPALTIGKSHAGSFTQGQNGATYSVTVSNAAGSGPTSGTVTVTESAPSGMTVSSMSGTGWTCTTNTCVRSDVLASNASYPVMTVTVSVSSSAGSPLVNSVSVSGGGSSAASATDSTTILPAASLLSAFFMGQISLGSGVYYLTFPDGNLFGYYGYPSSGWIYHFDLGYEYVSPVSPGSGTDVYLYDLASGHWWYTNSTQFPYLYDFTLKSWIYYFPAGNIPGHYTTNPRYFSNLSTSQIFTM